MPSAVIKSLSDGTGPLGAAGSPGWCSSCGSAAAARRRLGRALFHRLTAVTAFQASDFRARIRKAAGRNLGRSRSPQHVRLGTSLRLSVKQTPVLGSASRTSSGLVIAGDFGDDGTGLHYSRSSSGTSARGRCHGPKGRARSV